MEEKADFVSAGVQDRASYRNMIIMLSFVLLISILLSLVPRQFLLRRFEDYEKREIERNVTMLSYALQAELKSLENLNGDWAQWDDSYRFIVDRNQEYINSNLQMEYLKSNTEIDLISFYDINNGLSWGGIYSSPTEDKENNDNTSLQKDIDQLVSRNNFKENTGLLMTAKGLLIISFHPIMPSTGEGQIAGTLVMGRYLNDSLLKNMSHQLQLKINSPPNHIYSAAENEVLPRLQNTDYLVVNTPAKGDLLVCLLMDDLRGGYFSAYCRLGRGFWIL